MSKKGFLVLLAGFCLLLPAAGNTAEKPQPGEKPRAGETISAEDLQVIAHLELLQKMEMLKDFKILTTGEEKQ